MRQGETPRKSKAETRRPAGPKSSKDDDSGRRELEFAVAAACVRVWHITSRGWDPWTERPLPEVVRVAYPPDAVHNHFLLSTDSSSVRPLP
jgi:hypothetical protein